jgi:hypothetical protein
MVLLNPEANHDCDREDEKYQGVHGYCTITIAQEVTQSTSAVHHVIPSYNNTVRRARWWVMRAA